MSHQWMILAVSPGLLMTAAPADAATPFSRQVAADARGEVQVSNVSGDITITAWDRPAVDVQGSLDEGVERVDVDQDGGDVRIRVVLKDRDWRNRMGWRDGEARLQIRVPAEASIDASTVSGTVAVNGARGDQRLKSVSGSIRVDAAGREVTASTISGSVELTGTGRESQVRASSVSGGVRLRRMGGEIDARSTSGSVEIEASDASGVHVNVVSGSLAVTGSLAREATVDASSVSGRVRVAVRAPAGFRYDVSTFSGGISNCFNVETEARNGSRRGGWGAGERLSGERGEARASIRARSHSGAVEICDR